MVFSSGINKIESFIVWFKLASFQDSKHRSLLDVASPSKAPLPGFMLGTENIQEYSEKHIHSRYPHKGKSSSPQEETNSWSKIAGVNSNKVSVLGGLNKSNALRDLTHHN